MYSRELTMDCKRGQHDVGDIITLNGEKWIATEVRYGVSDHVVFKPLQDVIIKVHYIKLEGEPHPIRLADYINDMVDNYNRRNSS